MSFWLVGTLRRSFATSPAERWVSAINLSRSELTALAVSTEKEFIDAANALHGIYSRTSETAREAGAAADLMGGGGMATAAEEVNALLVRMGKSLGRSAEMARFGRQTLADVLKTFEGIRAPLAGFHQIARTLRVLGVYTRVENARVSSEEADFTALADAVRNLSGQVDEKASEIFDAERALRDLITRAIERVNNLAAMQEGRTEKILREAKGSLDALKSTHARGATAAAAVSSHVAAIGNRIGEVVVSMQFHDITRQQIEHVMEALDGLRAKILPADGEKGRRRLPADAAAATADVCALQAAQLDHSGEYLVSAVEKIVDSLSAVSVDMKAVATEVGETGAQADGETGNDGASLSTRIESNLRHVLESLGESALSSRDLGTVLSSVVSTLELLSRLIREITDLGLEIDLTALNARVKATRAGVEGASLGVLAQSIQTLSIDTRTRTSAISSRLEEILKITETLRGAGSGESDLVPEVEAISAKLGETLSSLSDVGARIAEHLSRLDQSARDLSDEIARVVGSVTIHESVPGVVGAVVARLEEMSAEAKALAPKKTASGHELANAMTTRYTMDTEREIHAAVFGGKVSKPAVAASVASAAAVSSAAVIDDDSNVDLFGFDEPSAPAVASPPPADDLGDNVELF